VKATRSAAPTTTLHQLQSWLYERVTAPDGTGSDDGRDARTDTDEPARTDTELQQRVVSGSLSAAERVEVYRHGYFARLVECLGDDYRALAHALGAQRFEAVCREFILLHPPASVSLNYYGAPLAEYLARRPESWSAFAAELARLEWAVVEAIHAEEGERLDVEALGRLSPEQWSTLCLVPSPALRLLFSAYPVADYYQAFKDGSAAPLAAGVSGGTPESPARVASAVVVCRRGEDVWRLRLSVPLGRLLESLLAGAPLLEALERFGSDNAPGGNAPGDNAAIAPDELQRAFRDWVSCGLFSGVAGAGAPGVAWTP